MSIVKDIRRLVISLEPRGFYFVFLFQLEVCNERKRILAIGLLRSVVKSGSVQCAANSKPGVCGASGACGFILQMALHRECDVS
jgi:hypothetical protein